MKKRELVSVNREMSIIVVKETREDGYVDMLNIDINNITIDEFASLCAISPETLTQELLAEVDLMLDEASNPYLKGNLSRFLALRERLVESFLYSSWSMAGENIANHKETIYDKSKIALSNLIVQVNKKTNEVVDLIGVYTPEFFKPYAVNFDNLSKEQKYGFIQSMPKTFIDEKMLAYFYNSQKKMHLPDIDIYSKKDLKKYLKIKNNFDMEIVLNGFSEHDPVLHEFALAKIYSDEPNV